MAASATLFEYAFILGHRYHDLSFLTKLKTASNVDKQSDSEEALSIHDAWSKV